jgi:predicted nucleotidyltransferase
MGTNNNNMVSNDPILVSNQETHAEPVGAVKRDIDMLFGSGTRVDLLWEYLWRPDQWLKPRDLARLTGRSLSDAMRNNLILSKLGLIEPYACGGGSCAPENFVRIFKAHEEEMRIFRDSYRLNKNHPWIPALRMLLERSIGSLKILSEAIAKIPDIEIAFVFGSFATSEQRPDSDIDLMVIGKHDMATLAEPISEVEKRTGREINYIAYSPDDWRTKFESRNYFVMSLIDSPKIFLIGDSKSLERITVPYLNEP